MIWGIGCLRKPATVGQMFSKAWVPQGKIWTWIRSQGLIFDHVKLCLHCPVFSSLLKIVVPHVSKSSISLWSTCFLSCLQLSMQRDEGWYVLNAETQSMLWLDSLVLNCLKNATSQSQVCGGRCWNINCPVEVMICRALLEMIFNMKHLNFPAIL